MNLIRFFIVLIALLHINLAAVADNHETKNKLVDEVKKINKEIDSLDEDLPLNDPFAGQSSNNSLNTNLMISEEEAQDEMSLYNFQLVGLITGKDNSYISLVRSDGEPFILVLGQYLGKIQLIDLRLSEAIFKKGNKEYIIIDFNNQIRESNEY